MKKLQSALLFVVLAAVSSCGTAQIPVDENYRNNNAEVNYQTFYDQLQPYGNWIDYPGIGYVWQPNAGPAFRPYETNGHWVSTVDGWAWASNYDWGWAPFHYGRWLYEPAIGWAWVPGYEWAPAWVTWGQYDDVYAWAPLAPGISISIGSTWRAPYNYWSFIPRNYINYSNPSQYIVRNRYNQTVVNNITIINNYNSYNNRVTYHRGPDYREVERYTHHTINPLAVTAAQRPGAVRIEQGRYQVYRPAVIPNSQGGERHYAPSRVRSIDEVRANGNEGRSRAGGDYNRGNVANQGINQNDQNTVQPNNNQRRYGYDRNGNFNNNSANPYNNGRPATTDPSSPAGIQRPGRWQRNNGEGNSNRPVMPAQPAAPTQPATNPNAGNRDQQNQNIRRDRWQQTQSANQAQPVNPNQPAYQNRNFQRGSNMPQPDNNNFRMQQRPPAAATAPANPAPDRNRQPIQRPQAAPERENGRPRGRE